MSYVYIIQSCAYPSAIMGPHFQSQHSPMWETPRIIWEDNGKISDILQWKKWWITMDKSNFEPNGKMMASFHREVILVIRQEANLGSQTTPRHLPDAFPPWRSIHCPSQAEPRTASGAWRVQRSELGQFGSHWSLESQIERKKYLGMRVACVYIYIYINTI